MLTWISYSLLESADFIAELEKQEDAEFHKEDLLPSIFFLFLMPLLPYLDFVRTRFIINQTQYGKSEAHFSAGGWEFYKIYLIAFLLFMAIIIVASIGIGVVVGIIAAAGDSSPEDLGENIGLITVISMIAIYIPSFFVYGYIRAVRTNMVFNNAKFGQDTFNSKLKTMPVSWLYLSNAVAIVCSVGLLIPWAAIRMARYVADNTEFESRTLDDIQATAESKQSALGEEFGDAFDLDLGL